MGRAKGYKMSDEQKQAIGEGMRNYYQTMSKEQKVRREHANNKIREFWKLYKDERWKQYNGVKTN